MGGPIRSEHTSMAVLLPGCRAGSWPVACPDVTSDPLA